jgi:hypothetical protein
MDLPVVQPAGHPYSRPYRGERSWPLPIPRLRARRVRANERVLAQNWWASVIYGGLLIATPFIGALVLTWWLGAYAAIKLYKRHREQPQG